MLPDIKLLRLSEILKSWFIYLHLFHKSLGCDVTSPAKIVKQLAAYNFSVHFHVTLIADSTEEKRDKGLPPIRELHTSSVLQSTST